MAHRVLSILSLLFLACSTPSFGQEADQDQLSPAEARSAWLEGTGVAVAAAPYTLTQAERQRFKGMFAGDLSHYSFDIGSRDPKCKTQEGYRDSACSCTIDWDRAATNGLGYIYSKASDGRGTDLSFARFWADLSARHTAKTLFRGAFHFLRPGVDPDQQADVFLVAIGAKNGNKPQQLPPVLDIEWSSKIVQPGSDDFNSCPSDRLTHDKATDRWICDMWHTVPRAELAKMAEKWINKVEAATGRPVIIYTNPSWWNAVMQDAGADLMKKQAVWTSRYTSNGPQYDTNWSKEGGSSEWGMAPLPKGASYPKQTYSRAHFWQFTEKGFLPEKIFTCSGVATSRAMDLDWLPITGEEFETLFGIKH